MAFCLHFDAQAEVLGAGVQLEEHKAQLPDVDASGWFTCNFPGRLLGNSKD